MREWMPFVMKYIALKTKSQWNHNNSFVFLFSNTLVLRSRNASLMATRPANNHIEFSSLYPQTFVYRRAFYSNWNVSNAVQASCRRDVKIFMSLYIYIHTLGQDTRTSRTTMPHIGRNFSSCPDVVVRKI